MQHQVSASCYIKYTRIQHFTAVEDFDSEPVGITISPGEYTTIVSIPIINDDRLEAVESFDVAFAIQGTSGARMGRPRTARVFIISEDGKL